MRKIINIGLAAAMLLSLAACAKSKEIDGVIYKPYGILTEQDDKNPDIKYDVVWGNVVWGIIFAETVVIPAYFLCFSAFEPVGKAGGPKGAVARET